MVKLHLLFRIGPLLLNRMFANSTTTPSRHIRETMTFIDRADFCFQPATAYIDAPQGIGYNATISAPHMHEWALHAALDKLNQENLRILDVGSGSGYLTACFAVMFGPTCKVTGIDHITELVEQARINISKNHKDLLDSNQVTLVVGDGRKGYPANGPYDFIHVGAAILDSPTELVKQLKEGGTMVAPIQVTIDGEKNQFMYTVHKDDQGKVSSHRGIGVRYIPLTDERKQREQ